HLQMTTLHPPAGRVVHGNAASCVMLLTIGSRHLLLTGDIESDVERELLQDGSLLRADAVVVPHHGSSTSSSAAFVRALMPRLAIVPAGANNRWGFPHRDVVDRWRAVGAEVLSTAESGAVTLRLCKKGGIVAIRQQRSNALAATD
ncbi:MAG: DNA internalization-related competence protein ComEC/Rec2, partial [Gammaproteobacteria bacterium]|nr:DNA internalization-related competence protein ComEC/Rec2 [Gammaproteobacteria bacterium]